MTRKVKHQNVSLIITCVYYFATQTNIVAQNATTENTEPVTNRPLYLTPYIQNRDFSQAKALSLVEFVDEVNLTSYSGFLTVNVVYDIHVFFWFFPNANSSNEKPIVLWISGEPGTSSLIGAFGGIGPVFVDSDLNLHKQEVSWATDFNLLFIDASAMAGFSHKEFNGTLPTRSTDTAEQIYHALEQFFLLFSEYSQNEFYLAGESYGSKHVMALAYYIHIMNPSSVVPVNLQGIISISSVIDLAFLINVEDQAYNLGLMSEKERSYFERRVKLVNNYLNDDQYDQALEMFSSLFWGIGCSVPTTFQNFTEIADYRQLFSNHMVDYSFPQIVKYFNDSEIRKTIHAGDSLFGNIDSVLRDIYSDIMRSYKSWVENLLDNNYQILMINGQFDLFVTPKAHDRFLRSLNWKWYREFNNAERLFWKTNDQEELIGYATHVQNLYTVTILSAGHVPTVDKPQVVLDAVKTFLHRRSFFRK